MNIAFGGGGGSGPRISVPYNAGDFSGTGGLTWTVAAGDVNGFGYSIDGPKMSIQFDLVTTTVGGVLANNFLSVLIPGGFVPSRTVQLPCLAQDNSVVWECIFCIVTQASNTLLFRRFAANWSAAVDTTRLDVGFSFFI